MINICINHLNLIYVKGIAFTIGKSIYPIIRKSTLKHV